MSLTLKALPYAYNALEPFIDEETMRVHHDKHHQTYVNNLNALLAGTPFDGKAPEELLKDLSALPDALRQGIINQGGGVYNHDLFWEEMAPAGETAPSESLKDKLAWAFGSFEKFQDDFSKAAAGVFGSGWTWLVKDGENLAIVSTPNQGNPISDGKTPVLGLDVWEHAYYLHYQNRRPEYIKAWWNVVNWAVVEQRLK